MKYCIVSGAGFAVDLGALAFGVEILGLDLIVANTISFTLGMITVYLGSIMWVFQRRTLSNPRIEFVIFCVVGVVVLAVNHAGLLIAIDWLDVPYYIAKVFAAGGSFVANFVIRKVILFR